MRLDRRLGRRRGATLSSHGGRSLTNPHRCGGLGSGHPHNSRLGGRSGAHGDPPLTRLPSTPPRVPWVMLRACRERRQTARTPRRSVYSLHTRNAQHTRGSPRTGEEVTMQMLYLRSPTRVRTLLLAGLTALVVLALLSPGARPRPKQSPATPGVVADVDGPGMMATPPYPKPGADTSHVMGLEITARPVPSTGC